MSNQVSSAQEISKEARIAYPVEVIQLGNKQQGVQEVIKATNTEVKGGSQETKNTIVLNLVVGRNTNTHSVDMDQLMLRGINDPRSQGDTMRPYTCTIRETNIER